MKLDNLKFTGENVEKKWIGFELPPPKCSPGAPTVTGQVHAYKGGYVNLLVGCQGVDISIKDMRAIVDKWDKMTK